MSAKTRDLVSVGPDFLRVHFRRFDLDAYDLFLRVKKIPESRTVFNRDDESYTVEAPARFAPLLGAQAPRPRRRDLTLSPFLYDDQAYIVPAALRCKRFACWSWCGSGKTIIALEWARHVVHRTGGRVLITTINDVVNQWLEEAAKFYGPRSPVHRIRGRQEMRKWMAGGCSCRPRCKVAVTNYEKWNPEDLDRQVVSEARQLAGVVLDENRLKTGGGVQKWAIIKSCRGIEYKLSLTATPAPNDYMEFASQASFLEKMRDEGEIIWTYFVRDPKSHRWTVKPHAREGFFRFLANWSIYVRDPKRYGWRLNLPEVPSPTVRVHEIEATPEQRDFLQHFGTKANGQRLLFGVDDTNTVQRAKLSQVAKGFTYLKGQQRKYKRIPSRKPDFVAGLIRQEASAGAQVLVWTVFDAESSILAERLRAAAPGLAFDVLSGQTAEHRRLDMLERFRTGESRVLVSRVSLLGFGMNFQHCTAMVFSGWNDSYEGYYQAVRRAYRHGQTQSVRVHIPVVPELEGDMWENLCRKESRHDAAVEEMERNFLAARRELML